MTTKERPTPENNAVAEFCASAEEFEKRRNELEVEGATLFFKELGKIYPALPPIQVWSAREFDWPEFPNPCLLEQKWLQIGEEMTQVKISLFDTDYGTGEFMTTGIITLNPEGVDRRRIIIRLKNYCEGQDTSKAWVQVEVDKPTRFKFGVVGVEIDEEPEPQEVDKLHIIQISCLLAEKYAEGVEKVWQSQG